ncbi:MAG: hypothetical protein GX087_04305 [Desulfobulbaceae bacterium]|nr:hypothetical protein [Desulfobulbaceae bacterium]
MSESEQLVRRILTVAVLLALGMAGLGWFFVGGQFVISVLLGAALACGSFYLLQRDIRQLMDRLAADSGAAGAISGMEKARFMIKSLGRFAVLALLLFAVAGQMTVQPVGLVLGLATIMLSVVLVSVAVRKKRLTGLP